MTTQSLFLKFFWNLLFWLIGTLKLCKLYISFRIFFRIHILNFQYFLKFFTLEMKYYRIWFWREFQAISCNYTKKLDRLFFCLIILFRILKRSTFFAHFLFMSNLVLISRRRCSIISLALFFEWNSVFTFSIFCLHFCLHFWLELLFWFVLSENGDAESHSKKKTKRMRTTFTEEQIQILQANFQIDSNPDGQDLERIAQVIQKQSHLKKAWGLDELKVKES